MANRYIRHGATFNGDGTSPDLATSNGGIGAWNDITYFEGVTPAYGTLPAGTTVYIRSKDASGANISITQSSPVTFGSSAATESQQITWIIDDGVVWPGVMGSVTYTFSVVNERLSLRDFNNFIANRNNFVLASNQPNFGFNLVAGVCYTKDLKVDLSSVTYGSGCFNPRGGTHENLYFKAGDIGVTCLGGNADAETTRNVTYINPQIELTRSVPAGKPVFKTNTFMQGQEVNVYGGRIFGAYATDGVIVCGMDGRGGKISLIGLRYPRGMKLATTAPSRTMDSFYAIGADGANSSEYIDGYFSYSTRLDNYYPTLNAMLNSGEKWVYALYPFNTSRSYPARIPTIKKHIGATGQKAVTFNFLWPQSGTMGTSVPTKDAVYAVVQYVTDAGELRSESTLDLNGGNLAESTATWSTLTYGATMFKRYALTLTTSGDVAANSNMVLTLFCATKAGSLTDILIVDPDPVIA